MAGATPAGGTPDPSAEVEDPLAADKRTLAIGAASMVGLVAVGVVSAQLFVTGGCGDFGEPGAASASPVVIGDVFDAAQRDALAATYGTPFDEAYEVPGDADRLAALPDGFAATGATVTAFDGAGAPRAQIEVPGTVVGDGATLFDVALANELTGQVDAFTPIDAATLEPGACTDTAVVSEQFAFLLDARDGQLLQLRIDEDGDDPAIELRDGDGQVSELRLELPAGPAGVLGERVSGAIAGDVVVVARRVAADDPGAAIVVADADGGERRIEVDRAALVATLRAGGVLDDLGDDDAPLVVEVVTADADEAVLQVRAATTTGERPADPADPTSGSVALTLDLATGDLAVLAATTGAVGEDDPDPGQGGDLGGDADDGTGLEVRDALQLADRTVVLVRVDGRSVVASG